MEYSVQKVTHMRVLIQMTSLQASLAPQWSTLIPDMCPTAPWFLFLGQWGNSLYFLKVALSVYPWKACPLGCPTGFEYIIHKFTNFSNDYISVCNQETFEGMFAFHRLTILNSLLVKLVVVGSFLVESNSKTMRTRPLAQTHQFYFVSFPCYFRTPRCFTARDHKPKDYWKWKACV